MRSFLLTLAVFLFVPGYAALAAPEINDEGAQRLKTIFEKTIDYIDTVYGIAGTAEDQPLLKFEGELEVTQNDTYYAVTWPRMTYEGPEGAKVDLGVFAFNAMPTDKDGTWKMTMAIPATIAIHMPGGQELNINIGAQNAVGLFNEKINYFTKLDATYDNITLSGPKLELDEFKIGKVKTFIDWEEDQNGNFSGPANVAFHDIAIAPAKGDASVKIGTAAVNTSISQYVPVTLDEFKAKFLKHADTIKAMNRIPDPDKPEETVPPVDPKAIMDMVLDLYAFEMDGFNVAYKVENLKIENAAPEKQDENELKSFSLGNAFFALGVGGFKGESGYMEIGLGYSGIAVDPIEADMKDAVPQDVKIKLRAENIPVKTIGELGNNTLAAIAQNPEMAQMAGFGMAMKLPAILSQSGTRIVIEDNHVKNDLYHGTLDGRITADMNAVASAVGKINGVFEGLDALYTLVSKAAGNPENGEAAQLAQTLDTLKSYGKPGTGPNGKPAYLYELELTPQGKFLMNGQDMMPQPAPQATPQESAPAESGQPL